MNKRARKSLQLLFLVVPLLVLVSCLGVEAEFDLRETDRLGLTMRYRMTRSLWELGVFDEESQERSVPVSRRDAEETALRYTDVSLDRYDLEQTGEEVVITVRYVAGSVESLQGLWGNAGGSPIELSPDSGGIVIPLTPGVVEMDRQQRDLLRSIFADRDAVISVLTPRNIADARVIGPVSTGEEQHGAARFDLTIPMGDLVTRSEATVLEVEW